MSFLTYSITNYLGIIALTNPPHNSLVDPVFEDEKRLVDFLMTPEIKAVIVRGAGRHFCGGADVAVLRGQVSQDPDFAARLDAGKRLLNCISSATVPVIASITGSCLGAGLEIALACHFRIAAKTALCGFPEAGLRLMPGLGGTQACPPRLGRSRLAELILTARLVSGEEAAAIGLVDECVAVTGVKDRVTEFATSLVGERPAHLVRSIMQSIHNSRVMTRENALREESRLFLGVAREGEKEAEEENH